MYGKLNWLCASAAEFGKLYFLLGIAELGCVHGGHRNLHSGPCSVGHERQSGNDSGISTFDCCEPVHVNTHTKKKKILRSQRQPKRDRGRSNTWCRKQHWSQHSEGSIIKKQTNKKWLSEVESSQVTMSIRWHGTGSPLHRSVFLSSLVMHFMSLCETPHRHAKTTCCRPTFNRQNDC